MDFFFCWSRRGIATNGIFAVTNGIFAATNGICTGGGTRYKQRARKWVYFGVHSGRGLRSAVMQTYKCGWKMFGGRRAGQGGSFLCGGKRNPPHVSHLKINYFRSSGGYWGGMEVEDILPLVTILSSCILRRKVEDWKHFSERLFSWWFWGLFSHEDGGCFIAKSW
jgi:hypothetical protein